MASRCPPECSHSMVSLSLIYLSMEQQERESERESESLDTASLGHITAAAAAAAALSLLFSIYSFIQPNSILIASCSLSLLIHLHQQYRCQQLFWTTFANKKGSALFRNGGGMIWSRSVNFDRNQWDLECLIRKRERERETVVHLSNTIVDKLNFSLQVQRPLLQKMPKWNRISAQKCPAEPANLVTFCPCPSGQQISATKKQKVTHHHWIIIIIIFVGWLEVRYSWSAGHWSSVQQCSVADDYCCARSG